MRRKADLYSQLSTGLSVVSINVRCSSVSTSRYSPYKLHRLAAAVSSTSTSKLTAAHHTSPASR